MPLLTTRLRLHDIADVEAFVRAMINRSPLVLTRDEFDELTAEGLLLIADMDTKYQPGHGGADPATSRFSGYCARFLPNKLNAAWHQAQEHHRLATVPRTTPDGVRSTARAWVIEPKAGSLNAILEENPDGGNITALHTIDPEASDLEQRLAQALDDQWQLDRDLTIRVGVLFGEGETPAGAASRLGIRHADVVACVSRIQRVAHAFDERTAAA